MNVFPRFRVWGSEDGPSLRRLLIFMVTDFWGKECRLKKRDAFDVVEKSLESLRASKRNGWSDIAFAPRDCDRREL